MVQIDFQGNNWGINAIYRMIGSVMLIYTGVDFTFEHISDRVSLLFK